MEFVFETVYNQQAVKAMARGLRRTIRKKRSRRAHILGWLVIALGLLLTLREPIVIDGRTVITWCTGLVLLAALLFEDSLNAFFARRRMMSGTERAVVTFKEENYCSETAAGKTEWRYENIAHIAEDSEYFIFVFDQRYAQVYAKTSLTGGKPEEFRAFISSKTGKDITKIK